VQLLEPGRRPLQEHAASGREAPRDLVGGGALPGVLLEAPRDQALQFCFHVVAHVGQTSNTLNASALLQERENIT